MEKREYFCFVNWWCYYKDMLTPAQWCELEEYIFKFGLDGEYTDPNAIEDKAIRSAWVGISEHMSTMDYCNLDV